MMCAAAVLLVMCVTGATIDAAAEPDDNPIFAADARLELIFQRTARLNSGLTEGPAAAPDGSIYFTDMPFGPDDQTMIHRYDPKSRRLSVFSSAAGKSNGLAVDANGCLLACDGADGGGRCVARWNLQSGERAVIADRYQGKRLNSPNDLCVDRKGRIYFTDPRYAGSESRELKQRSVYRIEPDGKVVRITHDVEMPNGIVLSPDERTLYVGDHNNGGNRLSPADPEPQRGAMRLYAFPLADDGLVNGQRRTLIDFGQQNGCDGITVDQQGNVYVACRSLERPGVLVINPDGKELAFVPTGAAGQEGVFADWKGIPSNAEFGVGADSHSLYVTIDQELYRITSKQHGIIPVWDATKTK